MPDGSETVDLAWRSTYGCMDETGSPAVVRAGGTVACDLSTFGEQIGRGCVRLGAGGQGHAELDPLDDHILYRLALNAVIWPLLNEIGGGTNRLSVDFTLRNHRVGIFGVGRRSSGLEFESAVATVIGAPLTQRLSDGSCPASIVFGIAKHPAGEKPFRSRIAIFADAVSRPGYIEVMEQVRQEIDCRHQGVEAGEKGETVLLSAS